MIVSIIKCKSKDWKEHFKKEFGAYPPNATLQDVANDRVSMYGNHVDAFIKEKKMNQKKMFQVQERLDKPIVKEQDLLTRLSKLKQKKKNLQFKMHMMKYHQPVL